MRRARRSIGLLGGSFNPAHAGHIHISCEAKKRLGVSEIWWLVAPHNPLKSASDLVAYVKRVAHARALTADYPFIHIKTFEAERGWRYSIDTVRGLKNLYPHTQFVWLMGADNLVQFHRWRRWSAFASSLPIAIFDRAPFTFSARASRFCVRFRRAHLPERSAALLPTRPSPAWMFIHMRRHPLSATHLRKTLGENAFLPHTDGI